jgi:hypothetical protein
VLHSFSEVLQPTLQESCYPALLELYSELRSMGWVGGAALCCAVMGCQVPRTTRAAQHWATGWLGFRAQQRHACPSDRRLLLPCLALVLPCSLALLVPRRRPPPVVLSDDLVRDPEGTLRALCAALDLPWQPQVS